MFKELINSLSFIYSYAARSRGKLSGEELHQLQGAGHVMAMNAEQVLAGDRPLTQDEKLDVCEAQMIDEHIDEMVTWLIGLEIV